MLPSFAGMLVITWAGKNIPLRYVVAFAFGILFWFFVDTISGSAVLDVNSGFGGGLAQAGVLVLFLVGVISFFWVDRRRYILSPESAIGKYGLAIPLLVATALGLHGLGEGAAFGATAYSTSSVSLLNTFGGFNAGLAYVLHKIFEPMMIGACYSVYSKQEPGTLARWLKRMFSLSVVFVTPSILGAVTGYLLAYDATYFFALGTGAAIYVVFRLAGPLFVAGESVKGGDSIRVAVSWILGIMSLYFSALFHS